MDCTEVDNPLFHPIDMTTWPMAQTFYYYTQMAPTTYSVTVTMDVTILQSTLKREGFKFFPTYLYLVTRAIGKQPEMRVGILNGTSGIWEGLTPVYPLFHQDDKTTSLLWTAYDPCFRSFYERYREDTAKYGDSHGILTVKGAPPPNSFVISCIPWLPFSSFSLHCHGIKDYFAPSFESGKFTEGVGKLSMPLSITAHHATTEGYHLKVFFEELQRTMDDPAGWL